MQLRRLFFQTISFKSQSTAIKILYYIKDLAQMNETDKIYMQGQLIQELSNALSHVLKYEEYQKLPQQNKDEIKLLIATELYEHSKNYSCSPLIFFKGRENYVYEPGRCEISEKHIKVKGIGYNYDSILSDYTDVHEVIVKEITFPEDLFQNQKKLRTHIVSAMKEKYHDLLTNAGIYYEDFPKYLQTVGASIHALFSNGSSTKPLVEIITQYFNDPFEKDKKQKRRQIVSTRFFALWRRTQG